MTSLEIAASAVTTISILLAGRNSIHTWWTGIIGCVLFGLLFWQAKLYADVALQVFFVLASTFGWWQWLYGNKGNSLPITRAGVRTIAKIAPIGVLVAGAYGAMLFHYTDAYAPYLDSSILVFSVIAQWLLMQRKLESWWFWLLVNTVAVPLFASRELYLTAFLYACYWVNACIAYRHWRSLSASDLKSDYEVLIASK
ncbi:nicotinamide riboside transporter PnuC [Thalassolituus sp.]|jgi:nicotinamide mononucleotide transporter|uniref:nicotinamide riboside transporter PnuC n=1 Tax=Thalassolituus sp. TaxID=2030822 RepID=UPI0032D9854E